jgi:hypothetical protein
LGFIGVRIFIVMLFFEEVFDGRRVDARLRRSSGYAAHASDIRQHIPAH